MWLCSQMIEETGVEGLQALSKVDWSYTASYRQEAMRRQIRAAQPPLQAEMEER